MKKQEIVLNDASGGLNDNLHPARIAKNQFSILENIITDEGGFPGKKRFGKDLIQYGPIEPIPFQGVDTISALPDGTGPGAIRVTCTTTQSMRVGMKLTFYNAVPNIVENAVVITQILSSTIFKVTNTVALAVGNKFKETGTLHLWHMDAAAGASEPDDTLFEVGSPYSKQNLGLESGNVASVVGLMPAATPLARQTQPAVSGVDASALGRQFKTDYVAGAGLDGLTSIFFEAYIYINPTLSGRPVDLSYTGLPAFSNLGATNGMLPLPASQASGCIILGDTSQDTGGLAGNRTPKNGLSIFRDFDFDGNVDSTAPYIKFILRTDTLTPSLDTPPTTYTLTSKALPMQRWIFVRGSYIKSTGRMRLYISGEMQAEQIINGNITNWDGGTGEGSFRAGGAQVEGFDGLLDEMRIRTNVTEDEEPLVSFKEPRGKPWRLKKSDGTEQCIFSAGDSLYATLGDGARLKLNSSTYDVLGAETFSETADWDVFQMGDVLYLSNGTDLPKSWDGLKLRPWGEGTAALTLTSTNVGAGNGIGAGNHTYYYTFMFGDLNETGPSVGTLINYASDAFATNIAGIPTGTNICTARRIYRKQQSTGNLILIREIDDNTTTSLSGNYVAGGTPGPTTDTGRDGVKEAVLNTGNFTQMPAITVFTAIKKPRFLLGCHNRMFNIQNLDNPYTVPWSEDGAPDVFLPQSFVESSQDSGILIGMADYYGEIHISKGGEATLVLRGDGPANWTQLETLHPKIGAIDHWSFIHRTIPERDSYILCFWAKDGAYGYAGNDFFKISEDINGTVDNLTSSSASRFDSITTTQADFQAALNAGGSSTINMIQPSYASDGSTEIPGQLKIISQLDYLGLWKDAAPLVTGKILALAKGPAEGEFFFSSDADSKLYRTTNNFITASSVLDLNVSASTPAANGLNHKIIEICKKPSAEQYFLFTDTNSSGASGGGFVFKWNQSTTTASQIYVAAGLVYESDTQLFLNSGALTTAGSNPNLQMTSGIGRYKLPTSRPFGVINPTLNNLYLNHTQKIVLVAAAPAFNNPPIEYGFSIWNGAFNLTDINGGAAATPFSTLTNSGSFTATSGFLAVAADRGPGHATALNGFTITMTHREMAMWQGGSCRPQAFWDDSTSRLFFVAAGVEDGNGNRTTHLYRLTEAGVLTSLDSTIGQFSLIPDGSGLAYYTKCSVGISSAPGFQVALRLLTLNTGVTSPINTIGSNYLVLRLAFNSSNQRLLYGGKYFNATTGDQNYFQFNGFLQGSSTGAIFKPLLTLAQNSDQASFPTELAWQSNGLQPFYAAMANITTSGSQAFYAIAAASAVAGDVTAYKQAGYNSGTTRCGSNLLFVVNSGAAGGFLWADRLYFFADGFSTKLVQLGVPGDWTVKGVYESSDFNTPGFSAFGNFDTSYQGAVSFDIRNASLAGLPAAAYLGIVANSQIIGFPSPAVAFQWRATLLWNYSVSTPSPGATDSPFVDFVDVAYYNGDINPPRVVGYHYKNRSYWALAERGQTENNIVMVYQKNNTWTKYTGWSLKGMNEFRGDFIALEAYQLVKLEVTRTDLGGLISTKARTGAILDDLSDKALRDANVAIMSFVNNDSPAINGNMKIQPYGGSSPLGVPWFFPILATDEDEPRQVKAKPATDYSPAYARALSLEISTSDDTGDNKAWVSQEESMATVILVLFVSPPRYRLGESK